MKFSMCVVAAAAMLGFAGQALADAVAPADVKFEDGAVAMPVSGAAGDPTNGANVFKSRKLGNCLACHANSAMKNELFHGEVGPELDGVADRWSAEELRAIIVNSKAVFGEETVMPGFYSLDVGKNVREDLVGKTILSAQEVEDVVAYLGTLKE
ncbi:sulfur oxidation c-type cytochrome SoxX [Salaquimonas pukyongi]|uniref:sulfur oxidation c-type cytochrome SoxX n=1 Tax=Salaquimonas pukyongi TaxID=2712698 RepID=UPI00096BB180|nr:sulfur oxidation c-type cytochrome SoxX [Salaquimonas pukyongi]